MSGALTHSPSDIIRALLIDKAQGTDPDDSGDWPIFVSMVPDAPDNIITVTDTTDTNSGRTARDGERQEHNGFQVAVRAGNHVEGYTKARAIAVSLDQDVSFDIVTVGSNLYTVWTVVRISGVIVAGKETPTSKRTLFTINALASLRQTV